LRSFLQASKPSIKLHLWVAVALMAVALSAYVGVARGNSWGVDDGLHFYRACQLRSPEAFDRPFSLLLLYGLCPFLGSRPENYFLALLAVRTLCAFLLYLLIWQVAPGQPLFAFACGAVSATVLVNDNFFIVSLLQQTDHSLSLLLTLLALNAFTAYQRAPARWYVQIIWLVASLGLVALTPLVRESTFPLLACIPLAQILVDWNFSRRRLGGAAAWYGVLLLDVLRTLAYLNKPGNYAGGLFQDLHVGRMVSASLSQLKFGFEGPFELQTQHIFTFSPAVLTAVVVMTASFLAIYKLTISDVMPVAKERRWATLIAWPVVGLLSVWLGFAAFLPTVYALQFNHTHVLSIAGESITLVGLAWLLSNLTPTVNLRTAIQLGSLAWLAALGATFANVGQEELESYGATWGNKAYFFRSLAQLVPAVKEPTLMIYIPNPADKDTPITSGHMFQYSLRYFYDDDVTGIVPTYRMSSIRTVSDEGIWYWEDWNPTPHTYGWEAIIFLTRDDSGRLLILDKLPDPYLTAYRQRLYHPYSAVLPEFAPPRFTITFPILSGPDWANDDFLVRH